MNILQTFEIKGETWEDIKKPLESALRAATEIISKWLLDNKEPLDEYKTHLNVNGSVLTVKARGYEKVAYIIFKDKESVWINAEYAEWRRVFLEYALKHVEEIMEMERQEKIDAEVQEVIQENNTCRPFRYYVHYQCEKTVGVIFATNKNKAKELLKTHYPSIDIHKWHIEEMNISADGLYEIYYGC